MSSFIAYLKAEMPIMDNLRSINGPQKYYNTSCHGSGEYTHWIYSSGPAQVSLAVPTKIFIP